MIWFNEKVIQTEHIIGHYVLAVWVAIGISCRSLYGVLIALLCFQEPITKAIVSPSLRRENKIVQFNSVAYEGLHVSLGNYSLFNMLQNSDMISMACQVCAFLSSWLSSSRQCTVFQSVCQSQLCLPQPVSSEEFCTNTSFLLPSPNVSQ